MYQSEFLGGKMEELRRKIIFVTPSGLHSLHRNLSTRIQQELIILAFFCKNIHYCLKQFVSILIYISSVAWTFNFCLPQVLNDLRSLNAYTDVICIKVYHAQNVCTRLHLEMRRLRSSPHFICIEISGWTSMPVTDVFVVFFMTPKVRWRVDQFLRSIIYCY